MWTNDYGARPSASGEHPVGPPPYERFPEPAVPEPSARAGGLRPRIVFGGGANPTDPSHSNGEGIASPAVAELRSKGLNFHGALKSVERRFGAATKAELIANVQGDCGVALRTGEIVSSGWYPVAWHDALHRAVEETIPERGVIRKLSYDGVTEDFRTIFKVVSLVASPSFTLTNSAKVMSRYYDGGAVKVIATSADRVHLRFEDYYGFTRRIWEDVLGGIDAVMDLMNVKRLPYESMAPIADGPRFDVIARFSQK